MRVNMSEYLVYGRCSRCAGDHELSECLVTPEACQQAAEWVLELSPLGHSTETVPLEKVAQALLAQAARVVAYDDRQHLTMD